ncbi:MAG: hypothetical protein ACYCPO_04090 [Acidobacteriaceae bacterium]
MKRLPKVLPILAILVAGAPSAQITTWKYTETQSPLDNQVTSIATLGTNGVDNEATEDSSGTARLIVRKTGSSLDVYIVFPGVLPEQQRIKFKFDDGTIYDEFWFRSADDHAAFYPCPKWFIEQMKTAKKVVVGYSYFDRGASPIVFSSILPPREMLAWATSPALPTGDALDELTAGVPLDATNFPQQQKAEREFWYNEPALQKVLELLQNDLIQQQRSLLGFEEAGLDVTENKTWVANETIAIARIQVRLAELNTSPK